MKLHYTHESIRLNGRWDTTNPAYAEATATGSYVEFAFSGHNAMACFDIEGNNDPLLHLWLEVDGVRAEAPNDRKGDEGVYLESYRKLLDVVRENNPEARIVSLSAFCGAHHEALGAMIADYNREHGCNVFFVDSFGWIPEEPLHPLRDGHRIVADHLIPILKEWI